MSAAQTHAPHLTRRVGYVLLVLLVAMLLVLLVVLLLLVSDRTRQEPVRVTGITVRSVLYGPGRGPKPLFRRPMGVAYGKDGRMYVADTGNNRVVVFDSRGRFLFEFGGLGVAKPAAGGRFSWKEGLFNYPTDVATDVDGSVYVADFRNDQIQVFDANGKFLRVFPDRAKSVGKGSSGQDGTGIAVTSVAVKDGRVYATDKYQIFVFDGQGKLLEQFGKPGSAPGDLDHPNGVAIGPSLAVVVSDSNRNRVVGFSPRGEYLWSVGRQFGAGVDDQAQTIEVPRGLAFRPDGSLVVADSMGSQLVILSERGEILGSYGRYGTAPGEFALPTDVSCWLGRIAVAEKGGDRVQVVTLSKK